MRIPASGWIAFLLGFSFAALMPQPGHPHDSWISDQGMRNPITHEWCCGEGDCFEIPESRVQEVRGGLQITFTQVVNGEEQNYTEVVPYNEVQPSPDGKYWRCKRPDGTRRCFFAKIGNT